MERQGKDRADDRARPRGGLGGLGSRAGTVVVCALLLVAALTAVAFAAQPDVGPATGVNTDYTPMPAKGSPLWSQVEGAVFPGADAGSYSQRGSTTPFDADFFTTAFFGEANGFAAGAQCRRTDPNVPVKDGLDTCARVPVIYRFTAPKGQLAKWQEVYRGSDATDKGGFVGAVAWINKDRALAVGGTGSYPRREPAYTDKARDGTTPCNDSTKATAPDLPYGKGCDQAGMARAWLYCGTDQAQGCDSIGWHELTGLPSGMRGLSALACSPREPGYCVAGGLGQLWYFKDGAFEGTPSTTALTRDIAAQTQSDLASGIADRTGITSPTPLQETQETIPFRVREIRFAPGDTSPPGADVVATTSGCCALDSADDRSEVLRLQRGGQSWEWHAIVGGGESYYSFYLSHKFVGAHNYGDPPIDQVSDSMLVTPGGRG